jgi:GAF domain-containing protein
MTPPRPPLTHLLRELIQIGIALSSERDLRMLLERIVAEARRFTNAEAGTLFLREGSVLRFAVVQNEVLEARLDRAETRARLQADVLPLDARSLAGYVASTAPAPCSSFLCRMSEDTMGVLQLINARDEAGEVAAFDVEYEGLVRSLASQAAVALRNARREGLSFRTRSRASAIAAMSWCGSRRKPSATAASGSRCARDARPRQLQARQQPARAQRGRRRAARGRAGAH